MLETPQIVETAAQETAFIRLTVPRAEIQNVMGPGLGELMAALAAQGIAPQGCGSRTISGWTPPSSTSRYASPSPRPLPLSAR